MLLGRCIFGIGVETLFSLKGIYTALWFHDQEISLAMGISELSLSFRFLAGIMYPKWAQANEDDGSQGLSTSFFYGLVFCIFSFICGTALLLLDRHR